MNTCEAKWAPPERVHPDPSGREGPLLMKGVPEVVDLYTPTPIPVNS